MPATVTRPPFSACWLPLGVPTPQGTDVTVDLGGNGRADDITVNFDNVQNGGTTSAELIDPHWAGELPPGYQIVGAILAFEIWTTATYTPPVTVCFVLSSLNPDVFAAARIFHNHGTSLVDVTLSKDPATQTILRRCELVEPVHCPTANKADACSKTASNTSPKTNAGALVQQRNRLLPSA